MPVKSDIYQSQDFKNALQELRQGDESQKNVAMVYDVAFQQISNYSAYAATPFEHSYVLRPILLSTLNAATESALQAADALKQKNMSSSQVLSELNLEQRFHDWIKVLEKALQDEGIAYQGL